ncbi:MAG: hypothetical protein HKP58_16915 [Desulfatitalea sp.]|nr:hypothetical protein [Desulfatitalea sp.]
MGRIKIIHMVWICCLAAVVTMSRNNGKEIPGFLGIAETREIVVNAEKAVEIKEIHVVPGQSIGTGQLLLKLDRPELTLRINEISHQLEELKVQQRLNTVDIRVRINQLNAQRASTVNDIEYKIAQLNNKRQINHGLTVNLKSIREAPDQGDPGVKMGLKSPIQVQIEGLEKELELGTHLIDIKLNALKEAMHSSKTAISIQVEGMEKELSLLTSEKEKLLKYSPIN